jgi:putative sterol carrier protein
MPTVAEVFGAMTKTFKPEAAPGVNAVIQFSMTGDQAADYYVTITEGTCKLEEGKHESPAATLTMGGSDFVDLVTGKLNPQLAFMQGKLKISGDMGLLLRFQSFFDLSAAG